MILWWEYNSTVVMPAQARDGQGTILDDEADAAYDDAQQVIEQQREGYVRANYLEIGA